MVRATLRAATRQWALALATALFAWSGLNLAAFEPRLSLESTPFASARRVLSLGDWGCATTMTLGGPLSMFYAMVLAILVSQTLLADFRHGDVIGSTPQGGTLGILALRTGSLATLFTAATFLGSSAFFLDSSNRAALLVTEDWPRIFAYAGAAWTLTFVWCSLAVALLHWTRSQLWTGLGVVAFQAGYSWLSTASASESLLQLVHRSFATWNFTGIVTPYGFSLPLLALQALCFVAIGCALLGGTLALGRPPLAPDARSQRGAKWLGTAGAVVAAGAVAATAWALGRHVAPFCVEELVTGRAAWDRPYVWSADYRFLAYAKPCMAWVWVPPDAPPPQWLSNPPGKAKTIRFPSVGRWSYAMLGFRPPVTTTTPADLLVVLREGCTAPPVVQALLERTWEGLAPVLHRYQEVGGPPPHRGAILWPDDNALPWQGAVVSAETLLFLRPYALGRTPTHTQWAVAEALAESITSNKSQALYVQLYLMWEQDPAGAAAALDWLRRRSTGDSPQPLSLPPLHALRWAPEDAQRVLSYWHEGQGKGHPTLIRALGQGGTH